MLTCLGVWQCYYIEGVRRKISKDLANGVPAELACKRLAKADAAICELKATLSFSHFSIFEMEELCKTRSVNGFDTRGVCFCLQEPRKLDKNINLDKMRVKQLRELMQALLLHA